MAYPVQAYVSVISGAVANAPVQMYVAVVDASGNLVSSTYAAPGGRLTLTTLTPVLTATVSASATVLYTPYQTDVCPIYDGTTMIPTKFTELTNTLSDATKNPAAAANNSNYDLFVWNDAGTLRLGRGPLWSSDTARSAGTALVMVNGILLNAVALTNGPAIQRGTYVGTIRTNGTATTDMNFGASGVAALLNVWNTYNRVDVSALVQDSTSSWNYTTATVRQANASAVNQVSFIRGLNEDSISTYYNQIMTLVAALGAIAINAVGLDSTTARVAGSNTGKFENPAALITQSGSVTATWQGIPGLGFHYIAALELGDGTNANGFSGSINHGLNVKLRA